MSRIGQIGRAVRTVPTAQTTQTAQTVPIVQTGRQTNQTRVPDSARGYGAASTSSSTYGHADQLPTDYLASDHSPDPVVQRDDDKVRIHYVRGISPTDFYDPPTVIRHFVVTRPHRQQQLP